MNSFSQFTLQPAFVGAWAINRALGMTFSLSYQYTHASSEAIAVKTNLLSANALFDFDMNELHWVPIGLTAGAATSFSVADVSFLQFRYQFGIFYTAVKPFNVGLEILYSRAPVVGETKIFLSSRRANSPPI